MDKSPGIGGFVGEKPWARGSILDEHIVSAADDNAKDNKLDLVAKAARVQLGNNKPFRPVKLGDKDDSENKAWYGAGAKPPAKFAYDPSFQLEVSQDKYASERERAFHRFAELGYVPGEHEEILTFDKKPSVEALQALLTNNFVCGKFKFAGCVQNQPTGDSSPDGVQSQPGAGGKEEGSCDCCCVTVVIVVATIVVVVLCILLLFVLCRRKEDGSENTETSGDGW